MSYGCQRNMHFHTYQEAAHRTSNFADMKRVSDLVHDLLSDDDKHMAPSKRRDAHLALGGLGLAGEAGEVADLIKKVVFHDHELDREAMKKELGDVLWYLAETATACGLTLEEIAEANIEKLRKRYPNGFSPERSKNR